MTRTHKCLIFLLGTIIVTSCFKEDEMVPPHPKGDVKTDTIAMTDTYKYQLYFSLDSGGVVKSNIKTASDLGFECTSSGWHIILNSSTFMKVADLGQVEFGQKQDTTGTTLKFDKSDGNPDSIAIGEWFTLAGNDTLSNGHVYAVSRGLDELGNTLGLYQVIFDSLKMGIYYFRYAPLSGGSAQSAIVHKDPTVNYIWFSLADNAVRQLEPPTNQYDLLFTQYTTLLYTDEGIPYPYLLTGVLSNRSGISIAIDSLDSFQEINRDIALTQHYSQAMDAIGWDWKYYDFNSSVYTIRPNLNYIIRNKSGYFYKLRFIGFYDQNGSKGYPVIEYQGL